MKNIQIDGTDVVREIFQRHAKSFIEIFVRPSYWCPMLDGQELTNRGFQRSRRPL